MANQKKSVLLALLSLLAVLPSCKKQPTLKGFDIDLPKAVCEKLGVKADFVLIEWDNKEVELASNQIDVIWNGMTITDQLKQNLTLSTPYLSNRQVLVAKNTFTGTLTGTETYSVAYENGSAGDALANSDGRFAKATKTGCQDQITALTEVASGTSDLAMIDSTMAGYYIASNTSYKSLKILTDYVFASEYYGVGGRKTDGALMAKINESITALYNDGTIGKIAATYGLTDSLVAPGTYDSFASFTDTSSYDTVIKAGQLKIGYTVFAPIAFEA
ncbi:MAG: transporter substrate-binding domain-containing protein [Bacilli bacterium]|jgi:polar amino acid transport system substrate-binding protein|nr:transporter substrate-binding domain-containing protein [Bacilli bacterium]